jgi:uncharacterized protein
MRLSLLGYCFSRVELYHKCELAGLMMRYPQPLSGYTFGMLVAWTPMFHYRWARVAPEALLIACIVEPQREHQLLQPIGVLPPDVQEQLVREARQLPYPLRIYGVSEAFLAAYPEFVSHFEVHAERDFANYVYDAADLATLAGHKYSKKRNLLAQAARAYAWTTERLGLEQIDACLTVLRRIEEEESTALRGTRREDMAALEIVLRDYEALALDGILVRVGGQPAGFAIHEGISPETAVVYFERAVRSHKGLYQVVNQETARAILAQGYQLINREEDLGDAGLRQAKESYFPLRLDPFHILTFKG